MVSFLVAMIVTLLASGAPPVLAADDESPSQAQPDDYATEIIDTEGKIGADDIRENLDRTMDISALVRQAMMENPKINRARIEWQSAIETYPEATSLPDPMVTFDYMVDSVETRVGPQDYRYSFFQKFPWPGTLGVAGEIIERDIAIKALEYEAAVRDTIVDLKLHFHELSYLNRAVDITVQNQDILRHFLKVAVKLHAADKTMLNDVLKTESQLAQLDYDIILLRELIGVEKSRINTLLNRRPQSVLGTPASMAYRPMPLSFDELSERTMTVNQDLRIAKLEVEKALKTVTHEKRKIRPMFEIGVMGIATNDALNPATPDSGKDPLMLSIGATIPWWRSKNRSRVNRVELDMSAQVFQLQTLRNKLNNDLYEALFALDNSRRLVELYEQILIPQANRSMEIAETWHQDEIRNISGLLETQTVWLNFNLAHARAIADYQKNLARIERLVGGSFPDAAAKEEHP